MKKENTGTLLLIMLGFIAIIGMFLIEPICQSQHYHKFSDEQTLLGVPNFLNVISNFQFTFLAGWNFRFTKSKKFRYK